MRRWLVPICMLFALTPSGAMAASYVGAPLTHGPDPANVATGPEPPAPSGGPSGETVTPGARLSGRAVERRLPSAWCGTERATDDQVSETANGGFKYHAVYMIPADGTDHFSQFATGMQTDA